jgi:hypothetical protein
MSAKLDNAANNPQFMQSSSQAFVYPSSRQVDQVDDYHGIQVQDPYRWLEDPDSEETQAWVGAQNQVTFGYLSEIPVREQIRERLTQLWNYERYGFRSSRKIAISTSKMTVFRTKAFSTL